MVGRAIWSIPVWKNLVDSDSGLYHLGNDDGERSASSTCRRASAASSRSTTSRCEIADGEFLVLVGPSGCGKSTLLRMIAGLEQATAGQISIGDRDVTDLAPKDRDIAMVFQTYALYPHMTVRQNLGYGLKARRTPKAEIARRVDEVAALLGLSDLLERRPAQLSGGQRQRVAMGRAIAREPQAFLLDEPLSNLDAKLRVGMRASLSQLHRRLGVTTVYVTHDQVEAMTLGQRVAVMRDGQDPPGRHAAAALRRAARPLRRRVHRLAGDEPRRGHGRGRLGALRPVQRCRSAPGRPPDGPVVPRDPAGELRGRGLRARAADDRRRASRCSRISAPTPTSSSRSTRARSRPRCARGGGRRRARPDRRRGRALHGARRRAHLGDASASTLKLAVDPGRLQFFDLQTGARLLPPAVAAGTPAELSATS